MKNKKMKLLSVSAAALITSSFASAAMHEITYTYMQSSKYTASKPMVGGVPDPTHLIGPAGSPILADYNPSLFPMTIPQTVSGAGWLDTTTGQIYLAPIDIEYTVVGGSYGYVGWSQTMNGSFSGPTFTMSGPATFNSGSMICESATSTACTNRGGNGSAADTLKEAQLYPDPVTDEFGDVLVPGGPRTVIGTIVFSGAISQGVTGQYIYQSHLEPAWEDTTLNITVGRVVYLPVPTAAWLFAPSLMALVAGKRLRAKKKSRH